MRKWIFWSIFAVALLIVVLGYVGSSPQVEGADGAAVDGWYADRVIGALLIGIASGAAAAWAAFRMPRHQIRQPATVFLNAVSGWGVLGLTLATFLTFAYLAYYATAFPANLAELSRVLTLVPTLRGIAIIGGAVTVAALAFFGVTAMRPWGGRPALYLR
jgi:hypothetical protein